MLSSGNHFVQQSRTISAILVKGHKGNIDVKYSEIQPLATEMLFKGLSTFRLLALVIIEQQSRTILAILVKGNKRNVSVKSFWNQAIGQGGDVV